MDEKIDRETLSSKFILHANYYVKTLISLYKLRPDTFVIPTRTIITRWHAFTEKGLTIITLNEKDVVGRMKIIPNAQIIPFLIQFSGENYFTIINMVDMNVYSLRKTMYGKFRMFFIRRRGTLCEKIAFDISTSPIIEMLVRVHGINKHACNFCYVSSTIILQKCSNCISTYYCSKLCQKKDWYVHRMFCGMNSRLVI